MHYYDKINQSAFFRNWTLASQADQNSRSYGNPVRNNDPLEILKNCFFCDAFLKSVKDEVASFLLDKKNEQRFFMY